MQHQPPTDGPVQLREVYSLVQAVRSEIVGELKAMEGEVRAMGARWDARLDMHKSEHERDAFRRSSQIKWAVTSLLSGVGVLASLWFALKG